MTDAILPEWASEISPGVFVIDGDTAYPAILQELADKLDNGPDPEKPDQYWLEVAYQVAKLDLRRALLLSGESAWPSEIRVRADKRKWRIADYPEGRGVFAATKGREARAHYVTLRGFVPN